MQGLGSNYLKISWCWERLKAGGERDDRDGWMASPTQWTWVWVNSGSWWWTGRPGVLQSMGSQSVGHDWVTELNWKSSWSTRCLLLHPQLPSGCVEGQQLQPHRIQPPKRQMANALGKCQFILDTHKTARGSLEENKNGERETEYSTGMEEFFFVDEWLCLLKISVR